MYRYRYNVLPLLNYRYTVTVSKCDRYGALRVPVNIPAIDTPGYYFARLAQWKERKSLNLEIVGSSLHVHE